MQQPFNPWECSLPKPAEDLRSLNPNSETYVCPLDRQTMSLRHVSSLCQPRVGRAAAPATVRQVSRHLFIRAICRLISAEAPKVTHEVFHCCQFTNATICPASTGNRPFASLTRETCFRCAEGSHPNSAHR